MTAWEMAPCQWHTLLGHPFAADAGICTAPHSALLGAVRTLCTIWSQARLSLTSEQPGLSLQHCQASTETPQAVFVTEHVVLMLCPSAATEARAIR